MLGYSLSHIILGTASNHFPIISPFFLLYQFGQLAYNGRFFIHNMSVKNGNSIFHTLKKLGEFGIGRYWI